MLTASTLLQEVGVPMLKRSIPVPQSSFCQPEQNLIIVAPSMHTVPGSHFNFAPEGTAAAIQLPFVRVCPIAAQGTTFDWLVVLWCLWFDTICSFYMRSVTNRMIMKFETQTWEWPNRMAWSTEQVCGVILLLSPNYFKGCTRKLYSCNPESWQGEGTLS